MRHPRIIIAGNGLAVVAAAGGVTAVSAGGSAASSAPSASPSALTGQGFQNFFVATPGIAPLATSSAPVGTAPAPRPAASATDLRQSARRSP